MTHVIFWDIDGTLLSTARGGVFALEDAARETFDSEIDLQALPTGGLTDAEIAAVIAEACGAPADDEHVTRFLLSYEAHLPDALPRRQGTVLPGVVAALEDLAGRTDVLSLLLTGNTPAGAAAKLRHYGLDIHISRGAFCTPPYGGRNAIAARAAAIAAEHLGQASDPERTFVIGDTPHDIRCARAAGARAVAVATGAYDAEALAAHDPWLLFEQLPDPAALRAALRIG